MDTYKDAVELNDAWAAGDPALEALGRGGYQRIWPLMRMNDLDASEATWPLKARPVPSAFA